TTGLTVYLNDLDNTNRRVKTKANNSGLLNKSIKEFNSRIENSLDYFHNGSFTINQVISLLQGKSDFKSIDDYVEDEIKATRKHPTYQDYKNTVNAIKLHLNYEDGQKLLFEDIDYRLLNTFKLNSEKNGMRGTSYNSYLKKLKAILNDAYDKGYIFKKIEFKKILNRTDTQRLKIKTCSSNDFKIALNNIKTIYDAQALGLYLLMFSCRGMYPADIVSFKKANFENNGKNEDMELFCEVGYDYLIHRRSKTRNRNNEDMYIRIDETILQLITLLKRSFIYTHHNTKPQILAPFTEDISIFNYSVDNDYSLHKNVWDVYAKRISKTLGYSFKTARKTFNTYALELQVSDTIRRILLGHSDPSELRSYDNLQTNIIKQQVEQAHVNILKEFNVDELLIILRDKISTLNVPKYIYEYGSVYLKEDANINEYYNDCFLM
ncbi:MAG: phage integrase SAM-like domain-containing protein, partial [Lutibacter sp.]|nr:phage integrase SAM-like domain-containing protein [Lutibacter sp.]